MRDSVEHTAIRIIVDSVKELHECAVGVAASHPNGKGNALVWKLCSLKRFCVFIKITSNY